AYCARPTRATQSLALTTRSTSSLGKALDLRCHGRPDASGQPDDGVRRLVIVARLEGVHLHDLRHSHASQLLAQRETLRLISDRLGMLTRPSLRGPMPPAPPRAARSSTRSLDPGEGPGGIACAAQQHRAVDVETGRTQLPRVPQLLEAQDRLPSLLSNPILEPVRARRRRAQDPCLHLPLPTFEPARHADVVALRVGIRISPFRLAAHRVDEAEAQELAAADESIERRERQVEIG